MSFEKPIALIRRILFALIYFPFYPLIWTYRLLYERYDEDLARQIDVQIKILQIVAIFAAGVWTYFEFVATRHAVTTATSKLSDPITRSDGSRAMVAQYILKSVGTTPYETRERLGVSLELYDISTSPTKAICTKGIPECFKNKAIPPAFFVLAAESRQEGGVSLPPGAEMMFNVDLDIAPNYQSLAMVFQRFTCQNEEDCADPDKRKRWGEKQTILYRFPQPLAPIKPTLAVIFENQRHREGSSHTTHPDILPTAFSVKNVGNAPVIAAYGLGVKLEVFGEISGRTNHIRSTETPEAACALIVRPNATTVESSALVGSLALGESVTFERRFDFTNNVKKIIATPVICEGENCEAQNRPAGPSRSYTLKSNSRCPEQDIDQKASGQIQRP